ncbi:hypothetical protein V6N13_123824 [Hibiscus sabdariffa]|uniref:Uncharacterized protein n=1 Tax=Hibiscus sabdariffa TaxID=183260 RepID=A0ABR2QUM8_9ROSI
MGREVKAELKWGLCSDGSGGDGEMKGWSMELKDMVGDAGSFWWLLVVAGSWRGAGRDPGCRRGWLAVQAWQGSSHQGAVVTGYYWGEAMGTAGRLGR